MTVEINQPITTTDLRKLIDYQIPEPGKTGARSVLAIYDETDTGWVVDEFRLYQRRAPGEKGNILDDEDIVLTVKSPLLTKRGTPKVYKTVEYLIRDMRAIGGDQCSVVTMGFTDTPPDNE